MLSNRLEYKNLFSFPRSIKTTVHAYAIPTVIIDMFGAFEFNICITFSAYIFLFPFHVLQISHGTELNEHTLHEGNLFY